MPSSGGCCRTTRAARGRACSRLSSFSSQLSPASSLSSCWPRCACLPSHPSGELPGWAGCGLSFEARHSGPAPDCKNQMHVPAPSLSARAYWGRRNHHNLFELSHRYIGWSLVGVLWVHVCTKAVFWSRYDAAGVPLPATACLPAGSAGLLGLPACAGAARRFAAAAAPGKLPAAGAPHPANNHLPAAAGDLLPTYEASSWWTVLYNGVNTWAAVALTILVFHPCWAAVLLLVARPASARAGEAPPGTPCSQGTCSRITCPATCRLAAAIGECPPG